MTEIGTPVYMDNQATTRVDPRVLEAMLPFFNEVYGNASSTDQFFGSKAAESIETAREKVSAVINSRPEEVIFTSGATEADNLAIQGVALAYGAKGRHLITSTTEHKAVLDTFKFLERQGCSTTYIPVDRNGLLDLDFLERAITEKTILISIIFANNEIGTISQINEIGKLAEKNGVLFHTDAAQAVGHIPVDVEALKVDLMSISGHKAYGPKGIGALYVRRHGRRVKPSPLFYGGGQERGLRSGTQNVPGIIGMGKALEIAQKEMTEEAGRFTMWTSEMRTSFVDSIEGSEQNGHPTQRLAHNLNIYFPQIESKALIQLLYSKVAFSTGSACTTKEVEPSHVLLALGFSPERAHSSVRFGLGRFNTKEEVEYAIQEVTNAVERLKRIIA